ncbi:hypothetical protein [Heyndrickxia coagulans]|nr:hypothetical protein [Heyndrickxia coagulans]
MGSSVFLAGTGWFLARRKRACRIGLNELETIVPADLHSSAGRVHSGMGV